MSNLPVSIVLVATAATVLFALSGCVHQSTSQSPADVDIAVPPPETEKPERVQPRKPPGYWTLAAIVRPHWEFGRGFDNSERGRHHQWGGEIATGLGFVERLGSSPIFGLGAGCTRCITGDTDQRRLYGEAHAGIVNPGSSGKAPTGSRISAGWSVHPSNGLHGPQITMVLMESVHMRWYRHFDVGSTFLFGLSVPLGVVHVTAR